jgi:hypothetical protein
MRSLKKVLSLVLALVLVLGLVTIGASAAYSDKGNVTFTDAVATTSALGIFNGYEDGSFNPSGSITRQEACKIIAMAYSGGEFDASLYTDASFFTDVDGLWGEGYINYLAGLGIVAGTGNGTFNPQGNITAQELGKILLVALGYPAELFTGSNWANYTNRVANSIELYEDYVGAPAKPSLVRKPHCSSTTRCLPTALRRPGPARSTARTISIPGPGNPPAKPSCRLISTALKPRLRNSHFQGIHRADRQRCCRFLRRNHYRRSDLQEIY